MTDNSCWMWQQGESVANGAMFPCGVRNSTHPNVPCCWRGDTCMSDGLCTYPHSLPGGSGYYAAGCTNSGFGDGCRSLCSTFVYLLLIDTLSCLRLSLKSLLIPNVEQPATNTVTLSSPTMNGVAAPTRDQMHATARNQLQRGS